MPQSQSSRRMVDKVIKAQALEALSGPACVMRQGTRAQRARRRRKAGSWRAGYFSGLISISGHPPPPPPPPGLTLEQFDKLPEAHVPVLDAHLLLKGGTQGTSLLTRPVEDIVNEIFDIDQDTEVIEWDASDEKYEIIDDEMPLPDEMPDCENNQVREEDHE